MNKPFEQSAAEIRALIAAGTIHPGALIGLAQNRLRRLAEWSESDLKPRLIAEARAVLAEGRAITAEFNAAR